jgi:hypothetical protein
LIVLIKGLSDLFRRFLGQKKDDFYIGTNKATPKDVLNMLSTAGVVTSNPYHFVRQGEINMLAEATPGERLKLLEDFAGISVFRVSYKVQCFVEERDQTFFSQHFYFSEYYYYFYFFLGGGGG